MIVVTGGMGFIGSQICRVLLNNGKKVRIFDKVFDRKIMDVRLSDIEDKFILLQGDLTGSIDARIVADTDAIIHTAAITYVPFAIKNPRLTYDVNVAGTFKLLELCRQSDVSKFVYISSVSTYGDFQYSPVDENHPLNPKEIYGASKAAADMLVTSYHHTYGMNTVVIRASSVYGPGDLERRVANMFVRNALQGLPMRLEGGGLQKRDFTYVKDIANGIVLALEAKNIAGEAFNVTGGREYSLKELAEVVAKIVLGSKVEVVEGRAIEVARGKLDISKAKNLLGYVPQYDLETGIKALVEWTKENADKLDLKVKEI